MVIRAVDAARVDCAGSKIVRVFDGFPDVLSVRTIPAQEPCGGDRNPEPVLLLRAIVEEQGFQSDAQVDKAGCDVDVLRLGTAPSRKARAVDEDGDPPQIHILVEGFAFAIPTARLVLDRADGFCRVRFPESGVGLDQAG